MNTCIISGNLGRDPILRQTDSGKSVLNFTIASDRRRTTTSPDGSKVTTKQPDWIPVVVFGQRAEDLARYLQKGSKVIVSGSLRPRQLIDEKGVAHQLFDIDASAPEGNVEFVSNIRSPQRLHEDEIEVMENPLS